MGRVHYNVIGNRGCDWVWHQRIRSLAGGNSSDFIAAFAGLCGAASPLALKQYGQIQLDIVRRGTHDLGDLARRWIQLDAVPPTSRRQIVPFAVLKLGNEHAELAANFSVAVVQITKRSRHEVAGQRISAGSELFPPTLKLWRLPISEDIHVAIISSVGRPPSIGELSARLAGTTTREEAVRSAGSVSQDQSAPALVIALGGDAGNENAAAYSGGAITKQSSPGSADDGAGAVLSAVHEVRDQLASVLSDSRLDMVIQQIQAIDSGVFQRLLDRLNEKDKDHIDRQIILPLCRQFMQIHDIVEDAGAFIENQSLLESLKSSVNNALSLHDIVPFRHRGTFDPNLQEMIDGAVPQGNGQLLISQRCGFRRGDRILRREKITAASTVSAAMERRVCE